MEQEDELDRIQRMIVVHEAELYNAVEWLSTSDYGTAKHLEGYAEVMAVLERIRECYRRMDEIIGQRYAST